MKTYRLDDFLLIKAGFAAVLGDCSCGGPREVNGAGEVPSEWVSGFKLVEQALGTVCGLTVADVFEGVPRPSWWDIVDPEAGGEMALTFVFMGVNDSPTDILHRIGVKPEICEKVESLFNDFFDGTPEERHGKMEELFVIRGPGYGERLKARAEAVKAASAFKHKVGSVVALPLIDGEEVAQLAEVLNLPENGCVMVCILPTFRREGDADGLCEVPVNDEGIDWLVED